MQSKRLIVVVLVAITFSLLLTDASAAIADVTPCIAGDWSSCLKKVGLKLGQLIWELHDWSSGTCVRLGPYQCSAKIKGRIHKLKWVWDGQFTCPTMVRITGGSRGKKSKNGAVEHAINDFINRVASGNHLTAQQWVEIEDGPTSC